MSAVERLEPVAARPHEAEALGVAEGSPLMLVERTAYAADGIPVEFSATAIAATARASSCGSSPTSRLGAHRVTPESRARAGA